MNQIIIKYGQVFIQLPDDDLTSYDLVLDVIRFFIDRLKKSEFKEDPEE